MKINAALIASLTLCLAGLTAVKSQHKPEPSARSAIALPAGTDAAAAREIARLFDAATVGETRALLILKDGEPVFERYGAGFGADSKLISWSMAKSITGVVAGLMVADGRLSLDMPAPIPAWRRSGDPRGGITLRHLLHMSSGLDHLEEGDPVYAADTVDMLFLGGASDMAAHAEAKPLAATPGKSYLYSSATSVIIADILARALTESTDPAIRRDALLAYMRGRLIEPTGMTSLTPEFDATGTMIGGSIMHATARDYARFGELLRNRGMADGRQVVSESWMRFMLTSSAADPGYGGHLWLNRPRPEGANEALWPGEGPANIFGCLGHQGQYIVVSPSQRLTIVRLGISTDAQGQALRDSIARLMRSL